MSTKIDWIAVAREVAPSFAERAAEHDAQDSFVAENYAALYAELVEGERSVDAGSVQGLRG